MSLYRVIGKASDGAEHVAHGPCARGEAEAMARELNDIEKGELVVYRVECPSEGMKRIELFYPRVDGHHTHVEIDLEDVRAADSILVSYDFDRDGWVIEQASVFERDADDKECDPDWQEVAFVQAWARERPCTD